MNGIDIESLLTQISTQAPSGESDLSSEPAFIDLAIKINGTPEREFGGQIVQEAKGPDWQEVRHAALELFARTHDLRVAMYITRALLHTDGFDGFAAGLALLHGLIERYWDSLFPRLDPDDNHDPIQRINILAALSEGDDILVPLKKTDLCTSKRLGHYCLRDVLIANGKINTAKHDKTPPPTLLDIEAAFNDAEFDEMVAKQTAIETALGNLAKLKAELNKKAGDGQAAGIPDFKNLSEALTQMNAIMKKQLQDRQPPPASNPDSAEATGAKGHGPSVGSAMPPQSRPVSGIHNRQDVIRLLDNICTYYAHVEPASPVPLLLKRARQLVEKNFIEIIQDLAPDSAGKIKRLIAGDDTEGS